MLGFLQVFLFAFVFLFVAYSGLAESRADDSERSLYAARCAVCHGAQLEGQTYWLGEAGRERLVRVPASSRYLAQAMPNAWLRAIILEGEAHIPIPHSDYVMPDLMLDAEAAEAVLRYLRDVWAGRVP